MRVGREPLDPEAIRLLEEHNPDVAFDWDRLLRSASAGPSSAAGPQGPSAQGARPLSREERRRERRDRRGRGEMPPRPMPAPVPEASEREELPADAFAQPATSAMAIGSVAPVEAPEPADEFPPEVPERLDTAAPAPAEFAPEPVTPAEPEAPVPAHFARLGAEGLRRLRARYADLSGRIAARPMEEPERAEALGRLQRINPDAWTSEDEVTRALEEYEVIFEMLRPLAGRPPRRRRL